jgi:hypothetical protein
MDRACTPQRRRPAPHILTRLLARKPPPAATHPRGPSAAVAPPASAGRGQGRPAAGRGRARSPPSSPSAHQRACACCCSPPPQTGAPATQPRLIPFTVITFIPSLWRCLPTERAQHCTRARPPLPARRPLGTRLPQQSPSPASSPARRRGRRPSSSPPRPRRPPKLQSVRRSASDCRAPHGHLRRVAPLAPRLQAPPPLRQPGAPSRTQRGRASALVGPTPPPPSSCGCGRLPFSSLQPGPAIANGTPPPGPRRQLCEAVSTRTAAAAQQTQPPKSPLKAAPRRAPPVGPWPARHPSLIPIPLPACPAGVCPRPAARACRSVGPISTLRVFELGPATDKTPYV